MPSREARVPQHLDSDRSSCNGRGLFVAGVVPGG